MKFYELWIYFLYGINGLLDDDFSGEPGYESNTANIYPLIEILVMHLEVNWLMYCSCESY